MAIPFVIINLDKPRKLRFGLSASVEFEQTTGIKLMALEDEMSMEVCAKLLWIMLKQDEPTLTFEGAQCLIDDYADDLTSVMELVTKAIQSAYIKASAQGKIQKAIEKIIESPNVETPPVKQNS